jgi:lysophospholipase L1-like esterase
VLNAGCSGYSAHQGHEILRRRGLKYRPDLVTIWFGWNDSVVWDGMTDAEHARLFVRAHLLTLSASYRVLSYTLRRSSHEEIKEEREETEARLRRMPLADYEARLREMVELARASEISPGRGARAVFIQGCYVEQLRAARRLKGRFELDDHQKAMAELAEQLDLPMLSVCDALYQAGARKKVFLDQGHLDAKGLRIVADTLFDLLDEHDMLPDSVGRHDQD